MTRTLVAAFAAAALGCVGPNYHRPRTDPPPEWRPTPALADSLRPLYDSLAASRDSLAHGPGDTIAPPPPGEKSGPRTGPVGAGAVPNYRLSDTSAMLTWAALFADSTLDTLVYTAIRQNRDVRTAAAAIEEFRADVGVAASSFFPQLAVAGQAGREKVAFGSLALPPFELYNVAGNLSWELDFWGRIRRSTQAAKAQLLAQEANQRGVVLDLVSAVATSYLHLRSLDLQLEISRRTLMSRQQTLRLARDRLDRGVISELDVRNFEADVADPASRVADFQRQIAQQENALSVLLGEYPQGIPRGRPLSDIIAQVQVPVSVPSTLLERRPDVRQAEQALVAATAQVGAAEAARFPTFTITGQYGYQSTHGSELIRENTRVYQIFGGVSIPVFTGGRLSSEQRAAQARRVESRYQFEKAMLTAVREVNDALAAIRADRDQVVADQTQVNALRRALQLAADRYNNGLSNYLDLLDAERSLFTAELTLAQIEEQELADAVALYRALGGDWQGNSSR
jgi:multidrug efflux system outer membrane protein